MMAAEDYFPLWGLDPEDSYIQDFGYDDLTRWICEDGEVLFVYEMEKDHLRNAIRYLRLANPDHPMLPVLEAEFDSRPKDERISIPPTLPF